ncbi:U32 family peptidase [Collinsella tanakaei]|uniref:U32 family peptidase n=1 Tax=Collinsella tanakaei TaxID=626935 RepID=UPI0025A3B1F5|nr:U32 family peptidase [Collinsella tanakaei]MDM8301009.1 U32 family peptidase [Collinsella tanakaei]
MSTSAPERLALPRHPELLSPAGGPEAFAAAIAAGADAIYCGMGTFNARRKATNFTDEAFEAACRTAHLAGTRVYVTVNIVIKDTEMAEALELIRRCAELGADAFIIQDWGLFFEVRRLMPDLELHVSTQANIHDLRGAIWCREAGADRVTLSRELSVPEIATIAEAGIDLEVFSHGSICFSYSGVCLLSSFACAGRSANRGMCAQPCRLPYELLDENGEVIPTPGRERALCPRDNCTADMLPELLEAGAGALKLEGRMKAPDYVYSVTRAYREALDDALSGSPADADALRERARRLKRCFNRDFTSAYQHGTSGNEMMSYERSNNRGQTVGEVIGSRRANNPAGLHPDDRRVRAAIVRIRLDEPVGAGDLIELRHDDEFDRFLTVTVREDAPAGSVIECRAARAMPQGSLARLIRSQAALDEASAALHRGIPRKRAVDVRIVARLGEPFAVELTCTDDPTATARAEGFVVEAARTRAVDADDLIEHVGRMGSSPFEAARFDVELDKGCGMGFSAVHKVRAAACEALERVLLDGYRTRADRLAALPPLAQTAYTATSAVDRASEAKTEPEICAIAATVEAARAAREAGAARVYLAADALEAAGLSCRDAVDAGIIPLLDEVCRAADQPRLDAWICAGAAVAVGNISELAYAAACGAAPEVRSCIPVHNAACLRALEQHGAAGFWLSPELTLDEIERIAPTASSPVGLVVSGKPRVMTSEHCILQVADACIHDCARCRLRGRDLSLRNIDGKVLPVRTDIHGRSRLYDGVSLDLTPQMPRLLKAGVTRFAVDGTLLAPDELAALVERAARALEAVRAGRKPARRLPGTSAGCLFVGVD